MESFLFVFFAIFISLNCGSNTRTPVIPFLFLTPPGIPQIVGVIPTSEIYLDPIFVIEGQADKVTYKPEFVLKYFVTNQEPNFVGYNLTITSAIPTLTDTLGGSYYTENGVLPSFPHLPIENSTEESQIKKRRIRNRIPAPGLVPFQHCEVYTFTLRAYFNNGVVSNPSIPVSACASLYPNKCPIGSSCNPAICSNNNCSVIEKQICPVGTNCNPCLHGNFTNGCECPKGVSPPGCNP